MGSFGHMWIQLLHSDGGRNKKIQTLRKKLFFDYCQIEGLKKLLDMKYIQANIWNKHDI